MKNMEIAGTGNSRFLRSALTAATTWEEARAMLIAGTFPIDLAGINEAGILQKGTPYDVDNVLKALTAALFGLDENAVPDDVFALIPGNIQAAYEKVVSYIDLNASANSGTERTISTNEITLCRSGVYTEETQEAIFTLSLEEGQKIVYMGETTNALTGSSLSSPYGAYTFSNDIAVNGIVLSDYHQTLRNPNFGPINFAKVFGRALRSGDELKIIHKHSNTSSNGYQAQTGYFTAAFRIMEEPV